MCGIFGILNLDGRPAERRALQAMARTTLHRGPDDEGYHVDGACGIGMRRLSIIDLAGGHQPLSNVEAGLSWSATARSTTSASCARSCGRPVTASALVRTARSFFTATRSGATKWSSASTGCTASRFGTRGAGACCSAATAWASSRSTCCATAVASLSPRKPRRCSRCPGLRRASTPRRCARTSTSATSPRRARFSRASRSCRLRRC